MFKRTAPALLFASLLLLGCNDDDNNNTPDTNVINLSAMLSGAQEVPSVPSSATGSMTGTYNKTTRALTYTVTYTGLTPMAGHIHTGAPGVNGPVIIPFSNLTSPITGTTTVAEANVADVTAGNIYVNLHTTTYTGGEIRGNITVK